MAKQRTLLSFSYSHKKGQQAIFFAFRRTRSPPQERGASQGGFPFRVP
jgi:hypothetical protein